MKQDKITVWRVENGDEVGPYDANVMDDYGAGENDERPGLRRDVFGDEWAFVPAEYYSGFISQKQLAWWFKDHFPKLSAEGFKARKYLVPAHQVKIGKKQVAFVKPKTYKTEKELEHVQA